MTAEHNDRRHLSWALVEVARVAGNFTRRWRGSVNLGFLLGISIMVALGQAYGESHGVTDSTSTSHSEGSGYSWMSGMSASSGISGGHTESASTGAILSHGATLSQSYSADAKVLGVGAGWNSGMALNTGTETTDTSGRSQSVAFTSANGERTRFL